ncbi:hypothetical protein CC2G_010995 [Coprinopsis cinerea AmutBmut pab1-1]|nr:hypothetical protein CC2G_010995 [Coprinopsis cinerea AmutBmut pab1-1]
MLESVKALNVNRLPAELLLEIFAWYLTTPVDWVAAHPRPIHLAWICTLWRNLVLSTPALWSDAKLEAFQYNGTRQLFLHEHSAKGLKFWMDKISSFEGGAPWGLKIMVSSTDEMEIDTLPSSPSPQPIFHLPALLQSHTATKFLTHLSISSTQPSSCLLRSHSLSSDLSHLNFPSLLSLSISSASLISPVLELTHPIPPLHHIPRIKRLALANVLSSNSSLSWYPFEQAESLLLEGMTVAKWVNVVERCVVTCVTTQMPQSVLKNACFFVAEPDEKVQEGFGFGFGLGGFNFSSPFSSFTSQEGSFTPLTPAPTPTAASPPSFFTASFSVSILTPAHPPLTYLSSLTNLTINDYLLSQTDYPIHHHLAFPALKRLCVVGYDVGKWNSDTGPWSSKFATRMPGSSSSDPSTTPAMSVTPICKPWNVISIPVFASSNLTHLTILHPTHRYLPFHSTVGKVLDAAIGLKYLRLDMWTCPWEMVGGFIDEDRDGRVFNPIEREKGTGWRRKRYFLPALEKLKLYFHLEGGRDHGSHRHEEAFPTDEVIRLIESWKGCKSTSLPTLPGDMNKLKLLDLRFQDVPWLADNPTFEALQFLVGVNCDGLGVHIESERSRRRKEGFLKEPRKYWDGEGMMFGF